MEDSISYNIYRFNLVIYKEERNINEKLFNLSFLHYINNDNNENKDICILTSINNNHYNLAFFKKHKESIDLNYIPNLNKY